MKTKINLFFLIILSIFSSCKEEIDIKKSNNNINMLDEEVQDNTSNQTGTYIPENIRVFIEELKRNNKPYKYREEWEEEEEEEQMGISEEIVDNSFDRKIEMLDSIIKSLEEGNKPVLAKLNLNRAFINRLSGIKDASIRHEADNLGFNDSILYNVIKQNPVIYFFRECSFLPELNCLGSDFLGGSETLLADIGQYQVSIPRRLKQLKDLKQYFFENPPRSAYKKILNSKRIASFFEENKDMDLKFFVFSADPFKELIEDLISIYQSLESMEYGQAKIGFDNLLSHLEIRINHIMGEGFFKNKLLRLMNETEFSNRTYINMHTLCKILFILKIGQYMDLLSDHELSLESHFIEAFFGF